MKQILLAILIILVSACHQTNKPVKKVEIKKDKTIEKKEIVKEESVKKSEIRFDSSTQTYLYVKDSSKVTGTLVTEEKPFLKGNDIIRKTKIVSGIPQQISDYNINEGNLVGKITLKEGKFTGTYEAYHYSGKLKCKINVENGKYHGATILYSEPTTAYDKVLPVKEIIYKNGKEIKTYEYDKNGAKIIPITDNLELVQSKTGYYEYFDNTMRKILYQPIVILKFKNTSNIPFQKKLIIKGVFISNGEEWAVEEYSFQESWDTALQPQTSRQLAIISNVGWTNPSGVGSSNISCHIFINNKLYKKIKIERRFLTSNRI